MVNGPKQISNLKASILTYLIITVMSIELKKFLLVTWKILEMFLNTLTADDKCSLLNMENLPQSV